MSTQLALITVTTLFLLASVLQLTAGRPQCTGPITTADYASYVQHVLAVLATVTPNTLGKAYGTTFPSDSPGYVQGVAMCTHTSDASGCGGCLEGLRKQLIEDCGQKEGGKYQRVGVCQMLFDVIG